MIPINWKVGDKVFVSQYKRGFKIMACDRRFAICTKPCRNSYLYFILDLKEQLRGPDNQVFCSGYLTKEQCEERLKELQSGEIEISNQKCIPFRYIVEYKNNNWEVLDS